MTVVNVLGGGVVQLTYDKKDLDQDEKCSGGRDSLGCGLDDCVRCRNDARGDRGHDETWPPEVAPRTVFRCVHGQVACYECGWAFTPDVIGLS